VLSRRLRRLLKNTIVNLKLYLTRGLIGSLLHIQTAIKLICSLRVDRVIITYPDGDKIDLFFEGKLEELGNIALFTIKLLCGGKKTKQSKTERR